MSSDYGAIKPWQSCVFVHTQVCTDCIAKIMNYQVFFLCVCFFLFMLYSYTFTYIVLATTSFWANLRTHKKHTNTSGRRAICHLLHTYFSGPVWHFWRIFFFKTKSYLFVYRWFNRWFIVAALRMLFQLTFMCTLYLIYLSRSTKRKEMTAILYDTFCKTAFRESGATF